ncbi:MAG: T9SS type A sorting domain-containing protein [Saprospiraceae bacterium]|nr:T9SS type A sorting domain-containing protein [Saprospiraceae bacterium]
MKNNIRLKTTLELTPNHLIKKAMLILGLVCGLTFNAVTQNAVRCLDYDGTTEYTDLGNPASLQLTTYTIELWFMGDVNTDGILTKGESRGPTNSTRTFDLFGNGTDIIFRLSNGSASAQTFTVGTYVTGRWNHVALVKSGTTITTYLNGANQVTTTLTLTPNITSNNWYVAGSGLYQLDGRVDELRFWNTARTVDQIRSTMFVPLSGSESGLVAYYNFNASSGVTLTDQTSTQENGTNRDMEDADWTSSYAPLGDATSQTMTDTRAIWQSTGTSSSLESRGLIMSVGTTLTEQNYAVYGHNNAGGSINSTDLTGSTAKSKYSQIWYVNKVGTVNSATLTFDLGTIAGSTVTVDSIADYVLLYRSGSSGNFVDVANASSVANSDQITFTGINLQTGYYAVGNNTLTWTGATSSDWETATNWSPSFVPQDTDRIIIPTTATVAPTFSTDKVLKSLSLNGTLKIPLGNRKLKVGKLKGGSSSSYIVTNGTGELEVDVAAGQEQTIPVGESTTSYDPVVVKPTLGTSFKVKVKAKASASDFSSPIANFAKVAPRQWDITPTSSAGSTVIKLKPSTPFSPIKPKIGHYKSSISKWEELDATHSNGTFTATTTEFSPFGVGDEFGFYDPALSAELVDFIGKYTEGGNLLTWTTANEVNNKGFQVERLTVNGEWSTLGFVAAKDKSATYQFIDNQTSVRFQTSPTLNYYRLRQIDNDGTETLSKVISIQAPFGGRGHKLAVYPNPVSNTLTIETETTGDYQIINLLGQQVKSGKAPFVSKDSFGGGWGLDVSALPQGSYFLKIGAEQVKFVKQQ